MTGNGLRLRSNRSAPPRRVIVSGIGAITPIGHGANGLWQGTKRGCSAIRRITHFDPSPFASQCAGEVLDFEPADYIEGKGLRRYDRCTQFAVAAAKLAIADSSLDTSEVTANRIGVCIGSALGGAAWAEGQHEAFLEGGPRAVSPALALQMFVGASSCNVAIELGATGYCSANADSCASGTIAIGNAWNAIRRGDADVMVAGGSEAPLAPLCFGAFSIIHAMSTRNEDPGSACRPFDKGRDGFVMAEGSAVLLLEEYEHARARSAPIYAELVGFACTNDGYHMAAPRPDGSSAAESIRRALGVGHILPNEVSYINAHGSSSPLNDSTETRAIKSALGEHNARLVPISSTKAMHGHALGASGAIEAAICCLSIVNGWIPPTINFETPDPECDLDYVPNVGRGACVDVAVSNSFGFGGINAALVLRRIADEGNCRPGQRR